jgi:hypothetical protein
LPVSSGGTGSTTATGTGLTVLNNAPTLVAPNLGTPSAINLANATNFPPLTALTGILPVASGGTGVNTSTGTGNVVLSNGPVFTGIPNFTGGANLGTSVATTPAPGNNTTTVATTAFVQAANAANVNGFGYTGFRNRIINGDMRIDQRHAGAISSMTVNSLYGVDRWEVAATQTAKLNLQQNIYSGSLPVVPEFPNWFGVASAAATLTAPDYFTIQQAIEGNNIADLAWGTSSGKPVTLSFWAYSSVTGNFGGSLRNAASPFYSYPFLYNISTANQWIHEVISIPAPPLGSVWNTNNTIGVMVQFSLGAGATYSGPPGVWAQANYVATTGEVSLFGGVNALLLTGVQFEAGTVATPFEHRPLGTELQLAQRYYESNFDYGTAPANNVVGMQYPGATYGFGATTRVETNIHFAISKRVAPTVIMYGANTSSSAFWSYYDNTNSWVQTTAQSNPVISTKNVTISLDGLNANVTLHSSYIISGGWTADADFP